MLTNLREKHADAQTLVSAHLMMNVANGAGWQDRLFAARDTTRTFLSHIPFAVTDDLLEDMWLLASEFQLAKPPSCEDIVTNIALLTRFTTPTATLRDLEQWASAPRGAFHFMRQSTYRRGSPNEREEIECLVVPPSSLASDNAALALLSEWMALEPPGTRAEYRLMIGDVSWGFYDVSANIGRYRSLDRSDVRGTIDALAPREQPWDATIAALHAVARSFDTHSQISGPV